MLKKILLSLATATFIGTAITPMAHADDNVAIQQALATLEAALPGKLLNNPYNTKWRTDGPDRKAAIVKSEGAPGGTAYQVRVKKTKRNPWDIATRIPMTQDITKGDVILLSYWARTAKPQKGREAGDISVNIQRNIEPYDSIFEERVALGTEWTLHYATGTAKRDYAADKTQLNFNLARARQTIEFGQFYIMNLGPNGDASKYIK